MTATVELTNRELETIEGMEAKAERLGITVYDLLDREIALLQAQERAARRRGKPRKEDAN